MAKIPVKIDEDIMDFIKSDAAKDYRSVSGQVNAILDLCRQAGGYRELIKLINIAEIQKEQKSSRPEARGRKRTKPQKITWDNCRGGSNCAAILYNSDDDKALIVKTNNPERDMAAIEQMLKSGKFPIVDVQADYSEKCCKFEVLSGFGNTVEEVRGNCDSTEFYAEVYDCLGDAGNTRIEQPDNDSRPADNVSANLPSAVNPPTTQEILSIDWDALEPEDALKQYLGACDNPELREVAEKYIRQVYAPGDGITYNTILDDDVLPIIEQFRRRYRK